MEPHERHVHSGHSSADLVDVGEAIAFSGIGPGDSILDLGCSIGDYSIAASKAVGNAGIVFSLDIHEGSIKVLKDRIKENGLKNIRVVQADMTQNIPLGDGTIDRLLLFNVLHGLVHNEELDQTMEEIFRVMRSQGVISIMEFRTDVTDRGPPLELRLDRDRIEALLQPFGLNTLRSGSVGSHHHMVLMTKH